LKLKLLAIALFVAGAASAQINPRISIAVTPGISPDWVIGGTQVPLTAFPLTPVPLYSAPVIPVAPAYNSTATRMGDYTYFHDSLGTNGTAMRLGDYTYSNYQNGTQSTHCTSTRVGTMVYTNCF
jgi:hypothetical protein